VTYLSREHGSDRRRTPEIVAGTRIAFSSNRDGNYEIYLMNADGSRAERLTTDPADDFSPAWSPDATVVAFDRDTDGNNFEIYLVNADGSGLQRLTDGPAGDLSPAWSPDGTRLAFFSDRDGNFEIYLMNADGSDAQRLTDDAGDVEPNWTPSTET
jgi:Tol biopolymer transport system component